jgi:methionyl-tRNA formyltransferase
MNLVIIAEESTGTRALKALVAAGHQVRAVLTSSDPQSTGWSTVAAVARQLSLPIWPASLVKDVSLAERLRAERVDLLLNVHSLHIVHESALTAPRLGAFNLHPGPLPELAGLNVPSWSIYLGESTHAVTLHRMEALIDTGAIAYREDFVIGEKDTPLSLFEKCMHAGVPLLLRLLEDAAREPPAIPAIPQDLSRRRYFGRGVPDEGLLRWERTARQIVNFVRACDYRPFPSPWPFPKTYLENQEISILEADLTGERCDSVPGRVGERSGPAVRVASADEWVLLRSLRVHGQAQDPAEVLAPGKILRDRK